MALWVVVGGDDNGILVRSGKQLSSSPASAKLATGAVVLAEVIEDGRMKYGKVYGCGPRTGWVSIGAAGRTFLIEVSSARAVENLRLGGLRKLAILIGVRSDYVDVALNMDEPVDALMHLIATKRGLTAQQCEFQHTCLGDLRKRAVDIGVHANDVHTALNEDNPRDALADRIFAEFDCHVHGHSHVGTPCQSRSQKQTICTSQTQQREHPSSTEVALMKMHEDLATQNCQVLADLQETQQKIKDAQSTVACLQTEMAIRSNTLACLQAEMSNTNKRLLALEPQDGQMFNLAASNFQELLQDLEQSSSQDLEDERSSPLIGFEQEGPSVLEQTVSKELEEEQRINSTPRQKVQQQDQEIKQYRLERHSKDLLHDDELQQKVNEIKRLREDLQQADQGLRQKDQEILEMRSFVTAHSARDDVMNLKIGAVAAASAQGCNEHKCSQELLHDDQFQGTLQHKSCDVNNFCEDCQQEDQELQRSDKEIIGLRPLAAVHSARDKIRNARIARAAAAGHASMLMAGTSTQGCNEAKRNQDDDFAVAEQLVDKGFALSQILHFYKTYINYCQIDAETRTKDVVSKIIIPETTADRSCYMESKLMRTQINGKSGGQRAQKLVSHGWKSKFSNTVLNIVLDATEWSKEQLTKFNEKPWRESCQLEGQPCQLFNLGVLDADALLNNLDTETLGKTYWLCIFAINQHKAICGECWKCSSTDQWRKDPSKYLQADPCLICGQKKINPCSCGSQKFRVGMPGCEIDKFDLVVEHVDSLVVSLDPNMDTIQRVWVVAEIGQAIRKGSVSFRLAEALTETSRERLQGNENLMETVERCQSSSHEDKVRIMQGIREMEGGVEAYDSFINCMLEVSFGQCFRLAACRVQCGLSARTVADVMGKLKTLEIDFTWKREMSTLGELLDDGSSFEVLRNLQNLKVNCDGCSRLNEVSHLGSALSFLELKSLTISLNGCAIQDVSELGKGIASSKTTLQRLMLNFRGCEYLEDVAYLGIALEECTALARLSMDFRGCTRFRDIYFLGTGLRYLNQLAKLDIDCGGCASLDDISALATGLQIWKLGEGSEHRGPGSMIYTGKMKQFQNCILNFTDCQKLHGTLQQRFRFHNGAQFLICLASAMPIARTTHRSHRQNLSKRQTQ